MRVAFRLLLFLLVAAGSRGEPCDDNYCEDQGCCIALNNRRRRSTPMCWDSAYKPDRSCPAGETCDNRGYRRRRSVAQTICKDSHRCCKFCDTYPCPRIKAQIIDANTTVGDSEDVCCRMLSFQPVPVATTTTTTTTSATTTILAKLVLNGAVASSVEPQTSYVQGNVIDGSSSTRWSSAYSDTEWIYVSLADMSVLDRVEINWELVHGEEYHLQGSLTAGDDDWYTLAKSVQGNEGWVVTQLVGGPIAKFVRMQGVFTAANGYSIYEFDVYGIPAMAQVDCAAGSTIAHVPEALRSYSSTFNNDAIGTGHAQSTLDSPKAWVPLTLDSNQWMMLDLGATMMVAGVLVQGRGDYGSQWVTQYSVSYMDDTSNWVEYDNGANQDGVANRDTVIVSLLSTPVSTRSVKLSPKAWHQTYIAMRADVLVCSEVSTTTTTTTTSTMTTITSTPPVAPTTTTTTTTTMPPATTTITATATSITTTSEGTATPAVTMTTTPLAASTTTEAVAFAISVVGNTHRSGTTGQYFNFNWVDTLDGFEGGNFPTKQCRNGNLIWEGRVQVWSGAGGGQGDSHGRRDTGASRDQWQEGDILVDERTNCADVQATTASSTMETSTSGSAETTLEAVPTSTLGDTVTSTTPSTSSAMTATTSGETTSEPTAARATSTASPPDPIAATSTAASGGGATTTASPTSPSESTTTRGARLPASRLPANPTVDVLLNASAEAGAKVEQIQALMQESVQSLLGGLGNGSNATVRTPVGTLTVFSLAQALSSGSSATMEAEGGSKVSVSPEVAASLPQGSVLAVLSFDQSAGVFAGIGGAGGVQLETEGVDVSVFDAGAQQVPVELGNGPMLIKLPSGNRNASTGSRSAPECAYLAAGSNGSAPTWSTDGVRRATASEIMAIGENPDGIWCATEHLSIFSAISMALIGCFNAELLTEGALQAIVKNHGWWFTHPSVIVLCLAGVLLVFFVFGVARDLYDMRLGRESRPGKRIHICRGLLTLGPQLIKYKYTIFLVYARDIASCIWAGSSKLKMPTLVNGVQRCFVLRTGISLAAMGQHCWDGKGWKDTEASMPHVTLCKKLMLQPAMLESVVCNELSTSSPLYSLLRFPIVFFAAHPLLDAVRGGVGAMTCMKRVALQASGFFGVLGVNAVIFNFSGTTRSWETDAECPISPKSQLFIVVATLTSIALSVLPSAFLADLGKQTHGRRCWTCTFWIMTLSYMLFSLLLVVTALANLNPRDQYSWVRSMRWALAFKILGMPGMQALRSWIMLEWFLRSYDGCPEKLLAAFGWRCVQEGKSAGNAQKDAEELAGRAIAADELVRFAELLERVMPGYDWETTTTEEVVENVVKPMTLRPARLEELELWVQELEVCGLPPLSWPSNEPSTPPALRRQPPISPFVPAFLSHLVPTCTGSCESVAGAELEGELQAGGVKLQCLVRHLGEAGDQGRPCLNERVSGTSQVREEEGSGGRCTWRFQSPLSGLKPEHILGFRVLGGQRVLGVAQLTLAEIVRSQGKVCELPLRPPASSQDGQAELNDGMVPGCRAGSVPGSENSLLQQAILRVTLQVPPEFWHALAAHEWHGFWSQPQEECHVPAEELEKGDTSQAEHIPPEAFCSAPIHQVGCLPVKKVVTHSRMDTFLHLLSSVLADALCQKGAYAGVQKKLAGGDFDGLLEWLRKEDVQHTRYWIDAFAMRPPVDPKDPSNAKGGGGEQGHWHSQLLAALPGVVRLQHRACAERMVSDLQVGRRPSCSLPAQLLVLDEGFSLVHQCTTLAELMLGQGMKLKQSIVLHPAHLTGPDLKNLVSDLDDDIRKATEDGPSWATPYLEDHEKVVEAVVSLLLKSLKDQQEAGESILDELELTDVIVALGMAAQSRADLSSHHHQHDVAVDHQASGGLGEGHDGGDADGD